MQVESSAIYAIGYDTRRRRLHVTFVSGQRYAYVGVPGEVHRAFLEADSKGRFFQLEIRDRYRYAKLG
ncbi:KTSC domain-containing protein [Phenylobacterium sp. LjRoot219]|uniref:KTSC domain-containing protein n=1 Tax=Phenylobacterium sp. LjRoot219 TaxID=3342283 RepID=UPI003ECF42D6